MAETSRELSLTVPLTDLASTSLFFVAFKNGLTVGDGEALIKAMREDLRRLESLVRTAQLEQREHRRAEAPTAGSARAGGDRWR